MAVINSVVIGRGKKSVGEVTLRYDRGRTIATRRITENKSNTESQNEQRKVFGTVTKALHSLLNFYFDRIAVKSRYGSQRNHYYKVNKRWFEAAALSWNNNPILGDAQMNFGELIQYTFDELINYQENGQINQANFVGACVAGNKDCTAMTAYVADGVSNAFQIVLEDVKDGNVENIESNYLVMFFRPNADTNINECIGVTLYNGINSDWAESPYPTALRMGYQKGDLGQSIITYQADIAAKTTKQMETSVGMPANTKSWIALPIIRYRTTKDEVRLCTMPWGAMQAGTTSTATT